MVLRETKGVKAMTALLLLPVSVLVMVTTAYRAGNARREARNLLLH